MRRTGRRRGHFVTQWRYPRGIGHPHRRRQQPDRQRSRTREKAATTMADIGDGQHDIQPYGGGPAEAHRAIEIPGESARSSTRRPASVRDVAAAYLMLSEGSWTFRRRRFLLSGRSGDDDTINHWWWFQPRPVLVLATTSIWIGAAPHLYGSGGGRLPGAVELPEVGRR